MRNHGRDENRDESHENALGKAYTGRTGWATNVGVVDFAGEDRKWQRFSGESGPLPEREGRRHAKVGREWEDGVTTENELPR